MEDWSICLTRIRALANSFCAEMEARGAYKRLGAQLSLRRTCALNMWLSSGVSARWRARRGGASQPICWTVSVSGIVGKSAVLSHGEMWARQARKIPLSAGSVALLPAVIGSSVCRVAASFGRRRAPFPGVWSGRCHPGCAPRFCTATARRCLP